MFDKRIAFHAAIVASIAAVIAALAASYFFADWARENSMLMAGLLGAVSGTIYPILKRLQPSEDG